MGNTISGTELIGHEFVTQRDLLNIEGIYASSDVPAFLKTKIKFPHLLTSTQSLTVERHEAETLMVGRDRE
jgi:hypothetical protein